MSPESALRLLVSAALVAALGSVDVSPARAAGEPTHALAATSTTPRDGAPQDASSAADLWISDDELDRLIRQGTVVLVDVRDESSFSRAHLLGAMSMPLQEVIARADELRAAGKVVVTYCGGPIGEKGARAARLLRERGLTNVRALSGGFAAWVDRGHVVEVQPS